MNRAEYMRELAYLLQDVPDGEREEALQYYEDYFDDAGPENEEQVIVELGRPEKLAAVIREGAKNGYESMDAEYTENGYQNDRYRGPQYELVPPDQVERKRIGGGDNSEYASGVYEWEAEEGKKKGTGKYRDTGEDTWGNRTKAVFEELGEKLTEGFEEGRRRIDENRKRRRKEREEKDDRVYDGQTYGEAENRGNGYENFGHDGNYREQNPPVRRRRNPFLWILAAIGLLCLSPFLIGIAALIFGLFLAVICTAGGIALAVICTAGGIALAVVIVAVVCVVTGVILFGVGIGNLFLYPLAGMMFMAAGLILFAIGILAVWLTVIICGKMIPGVVRMIVNFFSFFGRRRKGGAVS